MNKLKLMYDVVKTMKEKENVKGALQAEGSKDQVKVFGCANEFARNTVTGETKVKLNTEFNWDGQKMKHESCTEFNVKDCHSHMHPGMMRHMHCRPGAMEGHGPFPGQGPFHPHFQHGMHCGGLKGGLNKIAFLLQLLNNIKLEEKADQSVVLSLNGNDFPEEFKQAIREKMIQHEEMRRQFMPDAPEGESAGRPTGQPAGPHGFIKELHEVDNPAFTVNVFISKNNEIEKAVLEFGGKRKDENDVEHELKVKAELSFSW